MTASLTYLFCVVRAGRKPAVGRLPAHLPGAGPLRLLDVDPSTWLVVASVPANEYDEAALAAGLLDMDWVGQRAMAHEAVVEQFLGARAVLPMQLFALFTSDERAVAHVRRSWRKVARILARIDRQHEWGVRLTFDEKSAQEQAGGARTRRTLRSGVEYLARKRDQLAVSRAQLAAARTAANRIYRALVREATDARRRTSLERSAPGSRLLLDAAFLVPTGRAARFRAALRQQARALDAAGVVVSLTGPWPPYNFV
ncbi:MAG: GvpL/GvpF family gas vesicle protein [Vicinamibacterales bacterium]